MKRFVILRGLRYGNRFITSNSADPTRLADGTVAYEVIGEADTILEAQAIMDGGRTRKQIAADYRRCKMEEYKEMFGGEVPDDMIKYIDMACELIEAER